MVTRRRFIRNSLLATAGLSLSASELLQAGLLQQNYLSFDLHAHPGAFFYKGSPQYPGDGAILKTVSGMNEGGLSGAFFSLVADGPLLEVTPTGIKPKGGYGAGEAMKEYSRQLGILKELMTTVPASWATRTADLDRAFKDKKVAAFLACEGGEFLDGDAGRLEMLYADGVRSVQLVHYAPNVLGDLQTSDAQHQGLSEKGKSVVRRMNQLGMVIDVAHASFDTVRDVVSLTSAPIILSHTLLRTDENRPLAARTITVEHARLVAKTGGVIGAWPSGYCTSFDDFIENTIRLVEVAGVDHVGLGTDMDGNFKPVFSSYTQLPAWAAGLKNKGLTGEEVTKIMGGNVRRTLTKILS
ncbi:MAG: membrane dipeptidase [Cyclobacteriaceae bacterium]|nr:membrane dipeptidase [Cyclobacteriaceae bacterium]